MTRREFRETRLLLGLTQERLAKVLGVNRNTITKWELGLLTLPRIAQWAMKAVRTETERSTTIPRGARR